MPRDFWKWWWGGFVALFAVNLIVRPAFNLPEDVAQVSDIVGCLVWLVIALVGWRRNRDARTFSFWWAVAALISYAMFSVVAPFTSEGSSVLLALGVIWGIVWIPGGVAVIIVWLVKKSRGPANPIRPCPFCAEPIQAAAIKCKHCGEFLESPLPR